MPNINIVGRFSNGGTPALRHASMVMVRMYSSGAVMSVATVSFKRGERLFTSISKSLTLR